MRKKNQTTAASNALPPSCVTFWEACVFWLKLGCISFGGPVGQIALMHQELVERKRWISERRFLHALNYCMVLPGPEAQQLATYIGWMLHKTKGGIVAGTLFVLPSLVIFIALSWIYIAFGDRPVMAGLLLGIKPAVTAIVAHAAYRIGARTLKNRPLWTIALASFLAIFAFNIAFPLIVFCAILIGSLGGRLAPDVFQTGGRHGVDHNPVGAALIDDDTPTPDHALFSWSRLCLVFISCLVLWAAPLALLALYGGVDHILAQMGWFFTKAALLTFGGAYAVLPYVYQGAVDQFGWLSTPQMMDGLALGETTPGPLIMVVAFVGFIGGYAKEIFGADHLFMAGMIAACVVTWFTFLPSFFFILGGGPFVETTHNQLRFTAPLTAISAAVVGVILNLVLFFAYHVLWPNGLHGTFDWISALIAVTAGWALIRYKMNVMHVLIACALAGLLISSIHAYPSL